MRLPGDRRGSIVRENLDRDRRAAHDRDATRRGQGCGNPGQADLREAGRLRPRPGAGCRPHSCTRTRQAPDAGCHRHSLCLWPVRLRPQGHDRHCRTRRRGQRARDRPARAPPAARRGAHQWHPRARARLRRYAFGRHHPRHGQPVADRDGDLLHARRIGRRPGDGVHRRHRDRPSGWLPSAAARSTSWASTRPA